MERSPRNEHILKVLLFLYAFTFILIGFFNSAFLGQALTFSSPFPFGNTQLLSLLAATICILLFHLHQQIPRLAQLLQHPTVLNLLLTILALLFPLTLLEILLQPFSTIPVKDVSIYMEDDVLGWKLKPNISQMYDGTRVETNSCGLRNEEILSHERNSVRILFLGDSVTFGLRLNSHFDAFPEQTEQILNQESSVPYESINAGVPGYSTYQEFQYLLRDGMNFQPDIVILSFVLNDVFDTYTTVRFEDWGADSPVPYIMTSTLEEWMNKSSLIFFMKKIYHWYRYDRHRQQNAIYQELLNVQSLITKSSHPEIQKAWSVTLDYVLQIKDCCDRNDIQILLVIFPFRFQLETPDLWDFPPEHVGIPQDTILRFAAQSHIHAVDMFPLMREKMQHEQWSKDDLFQDYCHLTRLGCEFTAQVIAQQLGAIAAGEGGVE